MFLSLFLIILLFRLSIAGWNRGGLFGKRDDFTTEDQFMADDTTSGASYAIVGQPELGHTEVAEEE